MKAAELIGTPFSELDCFALVRECYRLEHGIIIPPARAPHDRAGMVFGEFLAEIATNWQECALRAGVGVAMRYDLAHPRLVTHFGYMVRDDLVLHTTSKTGAIIQRLSELSGLVAGYYDYKGKSCQK